MQSRKILLSTLVVSCITVSTWTEPALGAPFTPGNLVLTRVGDADHPLNSTPDNAAPVYLVEVSPADGSIIQEIPMPIAVSGSNRRFTLSAEMRAGILTRSDNGLFLTMIGYDADIGTFQVNRTLATAVNRVVARIDASGTIDTTTALNDCYFGPASNASVRSSATLDGTGFWLSGRDGSGDSSFARVRYCAYGATTSVPLNNGEPRDPRVNNIYNGRLYVSHNVNGTGNGQYRGVGTSTNSPLPTAALSDIFNRLPGYAAPDSAETISQYDFAMFDLNNDTVLDTLYVADDRTPPAFGGIEKFTFDGSLWNYQYTLNAGLLATAQAIRTLTGAPNGSGQVVLHAITAADTVGSKLVTVTDTGCPTGLEMGCTAADTFVELAASPTGNVYRGIRFAPRPCVDNECLGACCEAESTCSQATAGTCNGSFRGIQTNCENIVCPLVCSDPFADADDDDDVDVDDFSEFQLCFSGEGNPVTGQCKCFDRPEESAPNGDGDVDVTDLNAFINCRSGAMVPADPGCDG